MHRQRGNGSHYGQREERTFLAEWDLRIDSCGGYPTDSVSVRVNNETRLINTFGRCSSESESARTWQVTILQIAAEMSRR